MRTQPWVRNKEFAVNNQVFQIGTCNGLMNIDKHAVNLIAIVNSKPGNGDFEKALEQFTRLAKRRKKSFRIYEVWNEKLKTNLLNKRGFVEIENYLEKKR